MARRMRRVRITVDEPVRLPVGVIHTGTSYWLARTIDFTNALIFVDNDTVALREKYFDVELDDDETLYVKTQYVYNDGPITDPVNGGLSNESRISSLRGNQEGLHISDAIINTPKVNLTMDYSNTSNGELVLHGSEFKMFTSVGNHIASTWIFKDLYNNVLYKRDRDTENLLDLKLPITITKETNFIAELYYHSDTNANSNAGKFFNLTENKKSTLFTVEKMGPLIVGRPLYFKINLRTVKFKTLDITVKDMNGVILQEIKDLTTLSPSVPTTTFTVGGIYSFEFRLDIGNEYTDIFKITDIATDKAIQYDPNKTYLDRYDYKHLIQTQGKTTQLSYQLYNDSILLTRSGDTTLSLYKFIGDSLMRIGDIIDLPVTTNIDLPNLFVQELRNGDVVVSYTSRDEDEYGNIYIVVYNFNPVNNSFTLKHSKSLELTNGIVRPGSITTTWDNRIHYVTYDVDYIPSINSYDIYTDTLEVEVIPVTAKTNISIVRNMDDNIVIVGGTDTYNTVGNTVYGIRNNDKVLVYNHNTKVFTQIGTNLMAGVNNDLHSFHSVLRHDGKIVLFNTLDNGNVTAIDNQSNIIIDLINATVTVLTNDHVDDLPYLCTVVLNSGDVLRFSALTKDPQKVYGYISNTLNGGTIDDNNNIVRNNNELIVATDEVITEEYLKQYDIVRVEDNGLLKIVSNGQTLTFTSSDLIITRDTVMDRSEYNAGNWTSVILIDANLIIKDAE